MKTETKLKPKEKAVTKDMTFGEVLNKNPKAAEILFEGGLHCIGCGMAMYESLEDGCKAHGMSKKQIDDLVKKLNKKSIVNQIQGKIKRDKRQKPLANSYKSKLKKLKVSA